MSTELPLDDAMPQREHFRRRVASPLPGYDLELHLAAFVVADRVTSCEVVSASIVEAERARSQDPGTSHAAAAELDPATLRKSYARILACLSAFGPATDHRIRRLWLRPGGLLSEWINEPEVPPISESGLRTRRSELVRAGCVAPDTYPDGTFVTKMMPSSGRRAQVWRITERGTRLLSDWKEANR